MFCAYYLLKSGYSVTVLDRSKDGLTSRNNAGLLTPSLAPAPEMSYPDIIRASTIGLGPLYISPSQILRNMPWFISALKERKGKGGRLLMELGIESVKLYEEFFSKEGIDADVIRGVGALYESESEARHLADVYHGRFIGEKEVSRLGYKNREGGIMFDRELSINSMKLFKALRSRIKRMGARIMLGKKASFNFSGHNIESVSFGKSTVHADSYIAAAGSWSRELLAPLGYDPMIIPARGLVMMFSTGGSRVVFAPSLLEPEGVAVAQHDANTLRITSFFEFRGIDGTFSQSRKRWMLEQAERNLKLYSKLKPVYEGHGFRPCTPDQMPLIGRIPGFSNLLIAGGQCRVGVTLAPITGSIMAQIIGGQKPRMRGLDPISPSRFASR